MFLGTEVKSVYRNVAEVRRAELHFAPSFFLLFLE